MTGFKHVARALPRWGARAAWVGLLVWLAFRLAPQVSAWTGFGDRREPAPSIAVDTWDGSSIGERDTRGRVVVASFWATWCLPCRVEMPALQRLHEEHSADGLLVLGLVTDGSNAQAVNEFLDEHGIEFPIAQATSRLRAEFGGIPYLPTTILIDRRGMIRHRVEGLFAPPALAAAVGRLLGER